MERLAFFVNVYNALLLHAYVLHEGFPASYLEWYAVIELLYTDCLLLKLIYL